MGGWLSKNPVYEEYGCFFEDPPFFADFWTTGIHMETFEMRPQTKRIEFDCYMSGGETHRDDDGSWICVHNDEYPCNFLYVDASGIE